MNYLEISDLEVFTTIGVYEWEQRIRQRLLIDIRIPMDFKPLNDELSNTIDYDALCQCVTASVESRPFHLIETVAEHITSILKERFQISELRLRVSKPGAIRNARTVSVSLNW